MRASEAEEGVPGASRSMLLLGGSSGVGIVSGLLAAKVWALRVGPAGVGLQALVTSIGGIASLAATMGIGTALVRRGTRAGALDPLRVSSVRRAAWVCMVVCTLATAAVLFAVAPWLRTWIAHDALPVSTVAAVAVLSAALAAQSVAVSVLSTYRRVRVLARVNAVTSVVAASVGAALVVVGGRRIIPVALAAGASAAAVLAGWALRRCVPRAAGAGPASGRMLASDAAGLLRFGVPYTVSTLLSSGVVLVLPLLVLSAMGGAQAGEYRAAATISVGYVGVVLVALAQDFYPRASSLRDDPRALRDATRAQQRLILAVGGPIVLSGIGVATLLLPAAYSPAFRSAAGVFGWLMLANVFKFASWTLSFVQLARGRTGAYFLTEAIYGVATVTGTLIAVARGSLAGAGAAFLIGYAIYYGAVLLFVWRDTGYREESRYVAALALVVVCGVAIQVIPAPGIVSVGELCRIALAIGGSLATVALLLDRQARSTLRAAAAGMRRCRGTTGPG